MELPDGHVFIYKPKRTKIEIEEHELVMCRNCKHSESWYGDKSRCFLWHETGIGVFNDGFCNYGEKQEGR